jgi:membrane protease YdiL (CAAX protease family)
MNFFVFMSSWIWLVILANLVSYFLCFWSGPKRILQIFFGVLLPVLVGLGGIFTKYFQLSYLRGSVLETGTSLTVLWRFPNGVYFCVVGLFLIVAFTVRIHLGISSLPISLPGPIAPESGAEDTWNRYKWLIFLLLGPYFLFARVIGVLLGLTYLLGHRPPGIVASHPTSLANVLESVLLVAVLLLILRNAGREAVRKSIELPEPRYAFVALFFSVGISLVCAAVPYTAERVHWATYYFGKTEPPQFLTYFDVGRTWEPWLLLLIFGALAEEIIFRGVVLPRLVQRYGLGRAFSLLALFGRRFTFSRIRIRGFRSKVCFTICCGESLSVWR